jgi:hypothetical protein
MDDLFNIITIKLFQWIWMIPSSLECVQKKKRRRYAGKHDVSNAENKDIWLKVVQIERSPKENHSRRDKGYIQTRSLNSTSTIICQNCRNGTRWQM